MKRADINPKLNALSKSNLIALISEYAELNIAFREFVQMKLATSGKNTGNTEQEFKRIIDDNFGSDDIELNLPRAKEQQFDKIIDSLDFLNKSGRPEEAMKLTEYAFQYAQNIGESVMEPDYFAGQLFDDLIEIHMEACKHLPEQKQRVQKLIEKLEKEDHYGLFMNLKSRYETVFN